MGTLRKRSGRNCHWRENKIWAMDAQTWAACSREVDFQSKRRAWPNPRGSTRHRGSHVIQHLMGWDRRLPWVWGSMGYRMKPCLKEKKKTEIQTNKKTQGCEGIKKECVLRKMQVIGVQGVFHIAQICLWKCASPASFLHLVFITHSYTWSAWYRIDTAWLTLLLSSPLLLLLCVCMMYVSVHGFVCRCTWEHMEVKG